MDFGRCTIAPDRLLRCVVLKHLKGWSFRGLEEELRANLLYRRFTRFYEDPIPDHTVFSRLFALLGTEGPAALHAQVVTRARALGMARGHCLRTDTTAVETNIHHPSDSSLLADCLRVLSRSLKKIRADCCEGGWRAVDHARATKYRLLEIARAARLLNEAGQQRLKKSYGRLLRVTRGVTSQAGAVLAGLSRGELRARPDAVSRVRRQQSSLHHYLPLVERVIAQTQARVFEAQSHYPEKVLSLFEPHSVVIRKGKPHKPNEFGRLVRIDEVENGIVSGYEVAAGNRADQQQCKVPPIWWTGKAQISEKELQTCLQPIAPMTRTSVRKRSIFCLAADVRSSGWPQNSVLPPILYGPGGTGLSARGA